MIVLLSWLVTAAQAGQIQIDSLKAVLATSPQDTNRVNTLLALSKSHFGSAPEEAIRYGRQARQLSEKLSFLKGQAYSLKNIGVGYYMQGKYVEALNYWEQSLAAFDSLGDQLGIANLLSNTGAVYYDQGEDAKALEFYLKSLQVSEKINNKLRIATALGNIGTVYLRKRATYDKALSYFLRALPLVEEMGAKDEMGTTSANLGEIYYAMNDDKRALQYYEKALEAFEGTESVSYALYCIGKVHSRNGDFRKAIKYQTEAVKIARKYDAKLDISTSLLGLGETYQKQGNARAALAAYREALQIAEEIHATKKIENAYTGLAQSYAALSDYGNAFKYQALYSDIKDTLYNIETDKKLSGLLFNFEIEKKQGEIDLLTKDKELQQANLQRQKVAKNAFMAGMILVFLIAFMLYRNYRNKVKTNRVLDKQKAEIEGLLLNILPAEVAAELQAEGRAKPKYYESVTVLFTDFKEFSRIADGLTPNELVSELSAFFVAFDEIMEKYNLEKIKTIGDSYMCAGGIPVANDTHPLSMVKAGLEIQAYMETVNKERMLLGQEPWHLRVGIHTGPVVAGVVGKKKYAYDIWGTTVNIASRMESNGAPGKVNISAATYELVKAEYNCVHRGKVHAKNIGEIDMFFIAESHEDAAHGTFAEVVEETIHLN